MLKKWIKYLTASSVPYRSAADLYVPPPPTMGQQSLRCGWDFVKVHAEL